MRWIQELVYNLLELNIHNRDNHEFFHWQHQLFPDNPSNFLAHQLHVLQGYKKFNFNYINSELSTQIIIINNLHFFIVEQILFLGKKIKKKHRL